MAGGLHNPMNLYLFLRCAKLAEQGKRTQMLVPKEQKPEYMTYAIEHGFNLEFLQIVCPEDIATAHNEVGHVVWAFDEVAHFANTPTGKGTPQEIDEIIKGLERPVFEVK